MEILSIAPQLQSRSYSTGGGSFLQRVRRLLGLQVQCKPRATEKKMMVRGPTSKHALCPIPQAR